MTTIGFIGSGNIGAQLARLAVGTGHDVVVSNSRGPATLTDLVDELGPTARAATAEEAATQGDIVVVSIPLGRFESVPVAPTAGKVVIDTNNYYPERDGRIEALAAKTRTSTELLQDHLPDARVVKAFNQIPSAQLTGDAQPAGTPDRRSLVVFGDDADARATVSALIDSFGFDPLDGGPLAESWRIEPGTPGYAVRRTADELRADLAAAER